MLGTFKIMGTIDRIRQIEKEVEENGKITNKARSLWVSSSDRSFTYQRFNDACDRGMNNFSWA